MSTDKVNTLPTYILLAIVVCLMSLIGYAVYQGKNPKSDGVLTEENEPKEEWEIIYPNTKIMHLGDKEVRASIARTWPEKIKGLSNTPYLPADVVKLFVFEAPDIQSIWMFEMNYSLDIIWLDADGKIIEIKENISPDTYPENFAAKEPALYVIEAVAGFVAENNITATSTVVLPIGVGQ